MSEHRLMADRVVRAARAWIGTPYRHGASRRGVGCDCLGLLRGVWREVVGLEPAPVPPYAPEWAELRDDEPLLDAVARHLPSGAMEPGAVLVFRWSAAAAAKHCGILVAPDRMVHAYSGLGTIESPLVPAWRRRIVATHRFPVRA